MIKDLYKENIEFSQVQFDNYKFQTDPITLLERANNIKIVGHRGGFQPDNSMECFEKAVQNGVKYIETDVYLNKDQEVYIIHAGDKGQMDAYLNAKGLWMKDINNLEIKQILVPPMNHTIPKLYDFINFCKKNDIYSFIELKGQDRNISQVVVDMLIETQMTQRCELITFNDDFIFDLQQINQKLSELNAHNKNQNNQIKITKVYKQLEDKPNDINQYLNFNVDSLSLNGCEIENKFLMELKHKNPKMSLNVWWSRTINPEKYPKIVWENQEQYMNALDNPLDAITADYPLVVRSIVQAIQKKISIQLQQQ